MKRILVALLALSFCAAAFARQWAVADLSTCYLRAKPDYESGLESQCLMGTVLEITGEDRYWRQVSAPDYKDVWTTELGLALMDDAQKDEYIAAPKWICVSEYTKIYSGASELSTPVGDFTMGNIVRKDGASKISGWERVLTAAGREGWVRSEDVMDYTQWAASRKATPENIIRTAMRFVGVPYLWGGISVKGFDCSGFVKFVYMMNGVVLKRNAREQFYTGVEVPYDFSQMQPGDLLYFGHAASGRTPASITHVAMYIGGGRIIQSSQKIRINSLVPGEEDYYEKELVGVRRMLGSVDTDPGVASVRKSPWYFVQ